MEIEYLQWYINPCEACELEDVLFIETSFKDNIMGSSVVNIEKVKLNSNNLCWSSL